MNPAIANIFIIFLYVLIGLVVVRAIMSLAQIKPGSQFARFVQSATEPLMEPVRRFLPPIGGLDLSGIVVIVVLQLMVVVLQQVSNE